MPPVCLTSDASIVKPAGRPEYPVWDLYGPMGGSQGELTALEVNLVSSGYSAQRLALVPRRSNGTVARLAAGHSESRRPQRQNRSSECDPATHLRGTNGARRIMRRVPERRFA